MLRDVAAPSDSPAVLFRNEPGITAVLAPGTPHYLCPSPEGSWLGVVAPGKDDMGLSLINVSSGDCIARIPGAPVFAAWSADASRVAVHAGSDLVVVDVGTATTRSVVRGDAVGFRVPAVGPAGQLAYVARSGRLLTLGWGTLDGSGWAPGPVTRGGAVSMFRPGSEELWMGSAPMGNTGLLSRLFVARPSDTMPTDVYKGPFTAFSWSPSGRSLVLAVPRQPSDDRTALVAIGPDGTVLAECETFLPSDDQRAVWAFFDQYSHSHGSWLVDGDDEYYAFSGRHGTDRVSPSWGNSMGNRILLWRPLRGEPLLDVGPGELVVPAPRSVPL